MSARRVDTLHCPVMEIHFKLLFKSFGDSEGFVILASGATLPSFYFNAKLGEGSSFEVR